MSNSREQHQSQQQRSCLWSRTRPFFGSAAARPRCRRAPTADLRLNAAPSGPPSHHLQAESAPLPASCQAALDCLAGSRAPPGTVEYAALQSVLGALAVGTLPTPGSIHHL